MPARNTQFKILIIDDHLLFAEGLKAILQTITSSDNIDLITDTAQFVRQIEHQKSYDLVILDLQMPGVGGLAVIDKTLEHNKDTRILVVSATQDINVIQLAISKGAQGFVSKSSQAPIILDAVKKVASGEHFFDPQFSNIVSPVITTTDKTELNIPPRTLEVLQQVAQGHSNKMIAELLSITEATVKWHVTQLFSLLTVKNRTSCITKAAQLGLINLGP